MSGYREPPIATTGLMRAALALEFIGENYWAYQRQTKKAIREGRWYGKLDPTMERAYFHDGPMHRSKPWVARITGRDERHGLAREFLDGQIDYSRANSSGSRGVMLYYALTPGVYEVHKHLSWTKARRYFCRVEVTPQGEPTITEMTDEEVLAWLRNAGLA